MDVASCRFQLTLDQVAEVARRYRAPASHGPVQRAGVVEGRQRRHLDCDAVAWDQSSGWQAFSRLKALIRTGGFSLPDDDALRGELANLEARSLPAGGTRIAARGAGYDDRASVLAALVDTLVQVAPRDSDRAYGIHR